MRLTLATFAGLQVGDVLTTWASLRAGAVEANPYPRALLEAGGIGELAVVKVLVFFVVVWIAFAMPEWTRLAFRLVFQLSSLVLAFVVLSNAGIALR